MGSAPPPRSKHSLSDGPNEIIRTDKDAESFKNVKSVCEINQENVTHSHLDTPLNNTARLYR